MGKNIEVSFDIEQVKAREILLIMFICTSGVFLIIITSKVSSEFRLILG